jgi:hypothetical protein
MAGTLPERVAETLRSDTSRWLCDDCLAVLADVKQRQTVNTIASSFGLTSDFAREQGECSRCRDRKLVTKALHP